MLTAVPATSSMYSGCAAVHACVRLACVRGRVGGGVSQCIACRVISRSIAEYLVQAWDVRNSCKHNGAVLPLPSAPEGHGADGVDAMA
jgi:hypothetical protein